MFGCRPTEEMLAGEVRLLDRLHTVWLLARINILLGLSRSRPEQLSVVQLQTYLVNLLIDEPLFQHLKDRFGGEHLAVRQPFHSLQILTLIKRMVLDGAKTGGQRPDQEMEAAHRLGRCLIMTNDLLLSEESARAVRSDRPSTMRKRIALQLQLGPGYEVNNPPEIAASIVRSEIIFTELVKKVPCSLDIGALFRHRTGLALEEYIDHIFALLVWYTTVDPRVLIERTELACVTMSKFFAEAPKELGEMFWRLELTDIESLEEELRKASELKPQHDFISLRRTPLVQVAEDSAVPAHVGFIQEKLEVGLFWRIFNSLANNDERERFFADWGRLFEEYIARLLTQSLHGSAEEFHPFPRFSDNGDEAFDGLVAVNNYWVVMEFKGGFLKSTAKYAEDEDEFLTDIRRKFGDEKRGGIEQLARKIGDVFAAKSAQKRLLTGINSSSVTVVVPMFITQEPFVSSEVIGPYLAEVFGSLRRKQQLDRTINCTPPLVVDVSEIEHLKPYLLTGRISFIECIMERVRLGSSRLLSFGDFFRQFRKDRGIERIPDQEMLKQFRSIMHRISERFFNLPFDPGVTEPM
jgi:hypothetical protein